MEANSLDYKPIDQGGDLPEHRIQYFRDDDEILWDRSGRVDRLFGSGNGEATIPLEPLNRVEQAKATIERLREERSFCATA